MVQEEEGFRRILEQKWHFAFMKLHLLQFAKSDCLLQSYTFIADSGASSHKVYDETMIVNQAK
jgi:hypothetical protein